MDTIKRPLATRSLLAWGVIGILGIACILMGIGRTAFLTFEAMKFTAAGSILLAIAIYKLARGTRQR